MNKYTVFLDFELYHQIRSIRGTKKREILNYLNSLAENPFAKGELNTVMEGVRIEVKVIGKYSLLYYADHAVKEVKILDFYQSGT